MKILEWAQAMIGTEHLTGGEGGIGMAVEYYETNQPNYIIFKFRAPYTFHEYEKPMKFLKQYEKMTIDEFRAKNPLKIEEYERIENFKNKEILKAIDHVFQLQVPADVKLVLLAYIHFAYIGRDDYNYPTNKWKKIIADRVGMTEKQVHQILNVDYEEERKKIQNLKSGE